MDDLHYEPIESGGLDAHAYLKERVQKQIAWYDRKGAFNKRWSSRCAPSRWRLRRPSLS